MAQPALARIKEDTKLYPETLYYAKRVSKGGHQPVFKKLLPDGEPAELSPIPSQKLCLHSSNGFNFSYGGSAPAQLALALLLDATTDPDTALAYYQDFKWDIVARWGSEWSILRSSIWGWVKAQRRRELEKRLSQN